MKPLTLNEIRHILDCNDKNCIFCNYLRRELNQKEELQQKPLIKKKRRSKWTSELEQKAIELRNQGESFEKISQILGLSKPTVYFKFKNDLNNRMKKFD